MDNRPRIQRVSHRFKLLFLALIMIIPFSELMLWLFYNQLPSNHFFLLHGRVQGDLSLVMRLQLFIASLIPNGILIYGLVILTKLFGLYEKNIVFSAENVRHYRRLDIVAISWVMDEARRLEEEQAYTV